MSSQTTTAVFWNVWGHRKAFEIQAWLKQHLSGVEIFCLTEVTDSGHGENVVHSSTDRNEPPSSLNGRAQLDDLTAHDFGLLYGAAGRDTWSCMLTDKVFDEVGFGSALVYRNDLRVIDLGQKPVVLDGSVSDRMLQWIVHEVAGVRYLVAHLHGVWIKENTKGDHPLRLEQARQVREHLHHVETAYNVSKTIFGGDLNLALDTNALTALEYGAGSESRYRNLIKERGIKNTRTKSYRKFSMKGESMHADYVLVSSEVDVVQFSVETEADASDHAPLLITYR
ncbi:hypothetical protein KC722_00710 [Candidatus Kaiserbacteria bacterium]|nr:hypothetical protein [Candidatus Kaiserbacteria bacterium]